MPHPFFIFIISDTMGFCGRHFGTDSVDTCFGTDRVDTCFGTDSVGTCFGTDSVDTCLDITKCYISCNLCMKTVFYNPDIFDPKSPWYQICYTYRRHRKKHISSQTYLKIMAKTSNKPSPVKISKKKSIKVHL